MMRATRKSAFTLVGVPSVLVGILLGVLLSLSAPSLSTTHVNDSGTWRELQAVYVNDAGTWRTIQEIYVNDNGTWRSVFVFFSAAISPTFINTTANPSATVTCSAVGGTGPFSYSWVRISGDTRITANSPSSSSTTFSRTAFAQFESASATFRCTITDTATSDTVQDTIVVTMERPGAGG